MQIVKTSTHKTKGHTFQKGIFGRLYNPCLLELEKQKVT